jgi:hypothetical protein
MTPKERALEIYKKFSIYDWHEVDGFVRNDFKTLKNCINVINEIIDSLCDKKYKVKPKEFYYNLEFTSDDRYVYEITVKYYKEVKKELNKL